MLASYSRYLLASVIAALLLSPLQPALAAGPPSQTDQNLRYMSSFPKSLLQIQPPWSTPIYDGTQVTVPGLENVPDIHGDINDPQLVVFFAGNQFMVVNKLMRAFIESHPRYPRVVAFTLPPGRLITAIERGNGILLGNLHITLKPDILANGSGSMAELQAKHHWFTRTAAYAKNRLAIMVYQGNPRHVTGLESLAAPGLKLCMPNPEWEGIARHALIPALRTAGGDALVNAVYREKVDQGTTFLTHIHHRETPIRIMEQQCDAGVVWYTEAYFQESVLHHPIETVTIPAGDNQAVTYMAGIMQTAPHPQAAQAFLQFLSSPAAQAIYRHYGFLPPAN